MSDLVKLKALLSDKKILVVDDEPLVTGFLERIVKRFTNNIFIANDGEEGLEKFKAIEPDLVVTDISMPKLSGLELSREIKTHKPDTKIVIYTAHTESEYVQKANDIGIDTMLYKPYSKELFYETLEKLFGDGKSKN